MPTVRTFTAVFAVLVVLASAAPAAAGPVTDRPDGEGFDRSVYRDQTGDTVPLRLSVPAGERATLEIDGPGYAAETTLVDADGDGAVRVEFNSYEAGWRADERAAFRAVGADRLTATVRDTDRRDAPIASGRYRLTLDAPGRSGGALLLLSAPAFRFARSHAVPADAWPGSLARLRALAAGEDEEAVAAGDWAVFAFRADGLSGMARVDDPPVENLVWAADARTGAPSRHTVRHELTRPVTNLSAVSVDYAAGDGGTPAGLSAPTDVAVGVDSDDDGRTERELAALATTVPRNGTLRIPLADAPDVAAGETLVVRYDVRNPRMPGADAVALWLDERMVERGDVEYGLAGDGSLGNGLDFRVDAVVGDRTVPVTLPAHEYVLDRERDTLYAVVDARGLDEPAVRYRATLRLDGANPYVETPQRLTTRFAVVEPRTSFTRPDATTEAFGVGTERVAVSTSLAPGTELTARVTTRAPGPGRPDFLAMYDVTLDRNRTGVVEIRLPERLRGRTVSVELLDDGEPLAPPLVGRVR